MPKKKPHGTGLTIAQRRALLPVMIRNEVEQRGYYVQRVLGNETSPQFAYSIGLPTTFPGAAEVMMIGMQFELMTAFIHEVATHLQRGIRYTGGTRSYDIAENFPCYFGSVDTQYYDAYFGQAQLFHKSQHDFPVLQLVWCDTQGKFPWEAEFETRFHGTQPILFTPKY